MSHLLINLFLPPHWRKAEASHEFTKACNSWKTQRRPSEVCHKLVQELAAGSALLFLLIRRFTRTSLGRPQWHDSSKASEVVTERLVWKSEFLFILFHFILYPRWLTEFTYRKISKMNPHASEMSCIRKPLYFVNQRRSWRARSIFCALMWISSLTCRVLSCLPWTCAKPLRPAACFKRPAITGLSVFRPT